MTAIARLLFPLPALRRTPSTILAWWESRRLAFNATVGGAGLVTLAAIQLANVLSGLDGVRVPAEVVLAYGVLANLCYCGGFVLEALCNHLWGDDVLPLGPTLFRYGLVFSVGLTLFPITLAMLRLLLIVALRFAHGGIG